ncbi:MAG: phosphodiester glycosidase family protein [Actinomycetota bacterium]
MTGTAPWVGRRSLDVVAWALACLLVVAALAAPHAAQAQEAPTDRDSADESPPPPPPPGPGTQPPTVGIVPAPGGAWMVDAAGGVLALDQALHLGGLTPFDLLSPVVGAAPHPSGEGYWLVAADGGVFAFGAAGFHGSMGGRPLNSPVVGIAGHPSGEGYWLVAADGGVFAFGAAGFHGSMGGRPLNQPVVGIAAHPSGEGYWMVASDGGIFAFGTADFDGSLGGRTLVAPIVGALGTPRGDGYWMVAADGGVFAFGSASFGGSAAGLPLDSPIASMGASVDGGYLLTTREGSVYAFGGAGYPGSRATVERDSVAGYRTSEAGRLGPGIELRSLRSDFQSVTVVDVAANAPVELDVATAGIGPLETGGGARTTQLCAEVSCVVAVNGDFFRLSDRQPVGGLIVEGELIRTTRPAHEQLMISDTGELSVGGVVWPLRIEPPTGPVLLPSGLNTGVGEDELIVFSGRAGSQTPDIPLPPPPPEPEPDPDAPEPDPDAPPPEPPPPPPPDPVITLVGRLVDEGPLTLDSARSVELTARVEGRVRTPLEADSIVLIGRGVAAVALDELWDDLQDDPGPVVLDIGGDASIEESVGGAPPLLRDGVRLDPGVAGFVIGRNPRTAVGQRADGSWVLVTVDGRRDDRVGMTIAELADLLVALDVDTAINLDGGGSSALVALGTVRSSPSDGSERRVANALIVRPR